jgi:protein SCO1/2
LLSIASALAWTSVSAGPDHIEGAPGHPVIAGGSFVLVDQYGHTVRDDDFRGRFVLLYFGYTYCPDVCPLGLQSISTAIGALGPAEKEVTPVFITVDPERDTTEVLAGYTAHFHPRLIGLTGTREQIAVAAKAYGVRFFKLYPPPFQSDEEIEESTKSEVDDNASYLINHSASTYLVGPDGRLLTVFPHGTSSREMARKIQLFIVDNS